MILIQPKNASHIGMLSAVPQNKPTKIFPSSFIEITPIKLVKAQYVFSIYVGIIIIKNFFVL